MDLVDLFIGAEGTLGVVTQVTFRIVSPAPQTSFALVPCRSEPEALAFVDRLRDASRETWRTSDPSGIDAAAIENMDRRSIAILREDGVDARNQVSLPAGTAVALLVQLELAPDVTPAAAYDQIERALSPSAPDTALTRFCRLLNDSALLDVTELALPGDRRRIEQLVAIREGVPAGVNQRVGAAKRDRRSAHREDRGRHGGPGRALRGDDGNLPARVRNAERWTTPSGATSPTATCTRT